MPAGACDAHMHIYDAAWPHQGTLVPQATVDDYRALQARLGTQRTVIVTPRPYGTDNRVTLDAIQRLGPEHTRGVAVLHPDVSDATLQALHAGGIRGVRFTLYTPAGAVTTFEMVEPLAQRVQSLGWHLQLHWTADQIVEHRALLRRLRVPLVFDHLARLPLPAGAAHPACDIVGELLCAGRAWLKLSGAYLDSQRGEAGGYDDVQPVARHWVQSAPHRLVWGSDWPHATEAHKPDDATLLDLLDSWTDDPALSDHILTTHAQALYDFAA